MARAALRRLPAAGPVPAWAGAHDDARVGKQLSSLRCGMRVTTPAEGRISRTPGISARQPALKVKAMSSSLQPVPSRFNGAGPVRLPSFAADGSSMASKNRSLYATCSGVLLKLK